MKDSLHTRDFLLEQLQHIAVSITVMNNYRQIKLLCQIHLLAENTLLHLARLILLPVIIKADFANRYNLRMLRPHCQLLKIIVGNPLEIFRMIADRRIDKRMLFCQRHSLS